MAQVQSKSSKIWLVVAIVVPVVILIGIGLLWTLVYSPAARQERLEKSWKDVQHDLDRIK